MYNRYIPQPDGSHQRNRVPDHGQPPMCPTTPQPEKPPIKPPCRQEPAPKYSNDSIGGMLRNLLPKHFDSGDLIIILLLLLMANDCEENRNHALLTLALYFFL
ncbi:MAG: hypothetical protein J6Q54_02355 [Oscillospiraceae bacterium]|nr:hypothetical protein [Oscillospiraceae bacterium]